MPGAALYVWSIALDQPAKIIAALERFLTETDRARCRRLWRPMDRRRFIVSHGVLHHILASMTGAPRRMRVSRHAHGKPYLCDHNVEFSLSRSHECGVIAAARGFPVGIDVEYVRRDADIAALAAYALSPAERLALAGAADPAHAFFLHWTLKESYLKARGTGLSVPPQSVTVSLGEQVPAIVAAPGDETDAWTLAHFEPGVDYVGAIAARCPAVTPVVRPFDPASIIDAGMLHARSRAEVSPWTG